MEIANNLPEMIAAGIIASVFVYAMMIIAVIITRTIDAAVGRNTTDVPAPWPPKRRRWVRKLVRSINKKQKRRKR